MVARQSSSDGAGIPTEEALLEALAQCEAEVEFLREQLANMRSSGGEFLSDAAHAIRSPLTVTHSYLEILHSDLREGLTEEQQSFLGIAHENAVKLRQLVDDLVDLAALETKTAQIEPAPTHIEGIVASVQAVLQPIADVKELNLTTEVAADIPTIVVDEKHLEDVLLRLLSNAIQFTPNGGSVALKASADQGHATVVIVDNGAGIPPDRIADAFEPFVQLHRKPGENREGYGLGLPICRRIVEAFGGTLELESTEGEGTIATIRLPVSDHK